MTDLGLKILVDFISEGGIEMSCLCGDERIVMIKKLLMDMY